MELSQYPFNQKYTTKNRDELVIGISYPKRKKKNESKEKEKNITGENNQQASYATILTFD